MQYSIVDFQKVREQADFRLDADYYKPEYLNLEEAFASKKSAKFGDLVKEVRTGPFGSTILSDTYLPDGVILYRPFNIKNLTLESDNLVYLDEKDVLEKGLRFYEPGDIFFSRVGDVRCGIVPNVENKVTISPNIIAAKTDASKLNPYYATVFFNTKYGFPQIERGLKVVAQPTIQSDLIKNLRIIVLNNNFQNQIERIFKKYFDLEKESRNLYRQAEERLLDELGLRDWRPQHALSFVRDYSNAKEAKRWDADYHHPRYTTMLEHLKTLKHETLDSIASFSNGATPLGASYPEKGIPFLRIQNIGHNHLILDDVVHIDQKIHDTELKRSQLKPKDVLITITGRIGTSAVVTDDLSEANINQHIVRLRTKSSEYMPYYLAAFLNSLAGRLQTEREAYGTTREALPYYCLKKIIIPKIDIDAQQEITAKILDAQEKNRLSYRLLNIGKQAVEMAIEEDEQKATNFIENQKGMEENN